MGATDEHWLELRRALDEAFDRYQDLFACAPLGLLSLTDLGVVLEANTQACLLVGRDFGKLIDKPFVAIVASEDRRTLLDMLMRGRAGSERERADIRVVRADGTTWPVQVMLQRSRLDGQIVFRAALVDLSERQQHEQERLSAELERERLQREEELARRNSETKDRFLAVLSHELRTPLTPVLFAIGRLVTLPGLPLEALPLIRVAMRNLDLERQLIDDLLDMNRIANGKLVVQREPLDIHDIVKDALAILERNLQDRQLAVHLALGARESSVRGDANRLRQVFWNLLSNAMKFTSEGGQIRVTSANPTPAHIVLRVIDTGVGIEAERIQQLFEPFEQANRGDAAIGGLGLGLSICKGVIEAHEGTIGAHSEGAGQGTTFEVQLPLIVCPADVAQSAAS